MVNVWMPACFIFTPAAIPPNPAPTITALGVPAGPNSSSAVGLTATPLARLPKPPLHAATGGELLLILGDDRSVCTEVRVQVAQVERLRPGHLVRHPDRP